MNRILTLIYGGLLCLLFSACNPTRYLQEEEVLYHKSEIHFAHPEKVRKIKSLENELAYTVKPQPNSGFFKLPLLIHYWMGTPRKAKGLRSWIKNKFGEKPVFFNRRQAERNCLHMKKLMKDNGYFGTTVNYDTTLSKKKVTVTYQITPGGQYSFDNIYPPEENTDIARLVRSGIQKTALKKGKPYQRIELDEARIKLATLAGNNGYPDFSADHIYYYVDTLAETKRADIYIRIKEPAAGQEHTKYQLGDTWLYPEYDLGKHNVTSFADTLEWKPGFYVVQNNPVLFPGVLDRMTLQDGGQFFSKKYQDASVNHLLDLGVFKFVNIKYTSGADTTRPTLDRHIFLTPDFNQTTTAAFELNNRTGSYFGTAASLDYTHSNLFQRALRLRTNLTVGVETQLGNQLAFINTLDVNLQAEFSLPRFLLPFKTKEYSGLFVPRTALRIANNFQRRTGSYTLNSTQFSFGYQWKETRKKQHTLNPLTIERDIISGTSPEFEALLDNNVRLSKSFTNVFIGGLEYTYIYTNQEAGKLQNNAFFKGQLNLAGNTFNLFSTILKSEKNASGAYTIFQLPYSQFVALQADFRYYYQLRKGMLASRVSAGIGVAYGNASILPYSEQFFVGGANSIRAFRLRSLGPGEYVKITDPGDNVDDQFLDQTGDIKLEWNVEYRFPVFSFFKGALFADGGNIWLLNNEDIAGGKFEASRFFRQFGIGSGAGLRVDFEYLIIRLDVAFPLRRPYAGEGFLWTFDRLKFSDRDWRQDNLIYNLAIGYPF